MDVLIREAASADALAIERLYRMLVPGDLDIHVTTARMMCHVEVADGGGAPSLLKKEMV